MTPDPDDALRWEGDEPEKARPSLPAGWKAVGRGSDEVRTDPIGAEEPAAEKPAVTEPAVEKLAAAEEPVGAEEQHGIGNVALLSFGVIGGIYLLYAIGWAIGGLNLRPSANFLVADAMYLPWMWLGILAPFLWFLAVWVLTRGRATWIRILGLLAGVVLLVPWPFVMTGVVGA
ncbi:hypothetical protein J2Y69_000457 [Microbacterium resistens]|uniref:DNA polymerase III subunit gamma/tau n=1 Tax=Microbacterium resistens TaxID=156977 RepID=A0ABU1S8D1_9MICO|nr:hypothetical protein [Microbacterium resistens]MDR6865872.1 hypothetical protein [Microbacterium resistens]